VYHDDNANCFRAYGNEYWEFGADGLVALSHRKDQITRSPKHTDWPLGRRPDEHPGLSDLGLQEIPRDNVQSFAATPSKQYPATLSKCRECPPRRATWAVPFKAPQQWRSL